MKQPILNHCHYCLVHFALFFLRLCFSFLNSLSSQTTQFFTFLPDMFTNRCDNLLVGRLEMTGGVGDLLADVGHLGWVHGIMTLHKRHC
jgi:hypothetical protein